MTQTRRRTPTCPYELGEAGTDWWKWAWKTKQSETWKDDGGLYTAARRAQLEDERAALILADDDHLLADLLEGAQPAAIAAVNYALDRLRSAATGSTGLSREMRELETQLGLGPKAVRALQDKTTKPDPPNEKGGGLDQLAKQRAARRTRSAGS